MNKPRLIGLYSPAPQCGKSTVAEYLCRKHGFQQISFAGPLKEMADKFFEALGYHEGARTAMLYGDAKETPIPRLNVTPRYVMQTLGTEWGRNCIHPQVWVETAMSRAFASERPIVIDDLRFTNEFSAIRDMGGVCIKVVRPGVSREGIAHQSEGALDNFHFNYTLTNGGTKTDLYRLIDGVMLSLELEGATRD